MTRAQEIALRKIRKLTDSIMFGDKWEIKEWKVTENEYFVAVIVETGMKGDEGTLASLLCRERAQLFIGKRGGIRYPVYNTKSSKYVEWRFNGYSLLSVVIDQRL